MSDRSIVLITAIVIITLSVIFMNYFTHYYFVWADIKLNNEQSDQKFLSIVELSGEKNIDKSQFKRAPEFEKIGDIINITNTSSTQPLTMSSLKGKVVLVNFWTYSCINVLRTLPHLIDWNTKYADEGLVIVGVHSPEFKFEKDINNLESAVQRYGIKYLFFKITIIKHGMHMGTIIGRECILSMMMDI